MHLFDRIPDNLFSILVSKNKRIYLDALFVVHEGFKFELTLTRSELVSMLIAKIESDIYELQNEEEETGNIELSDLSSRANFLIRKLVETKWLNQETRFEDLESVMSFPDYASTLLDVLKRLTEDNIMEYNGLVVSSYNNLKTVDLERGDYAFQAVNRALSDTEQLIDLLVKQYHNIGRYHQIALEMSKVNDLLISHFDDFHESIVMKFLHPFKTFDSVPRFKGPILEILNKWYQDESIMELLSEQAIRYGVVKTNEDASIKIYEMITRMIEYYESLPNLVRDIDVKHNAYTSASIEKIQYLINQDQSIKGKLIQTIQAISKDMIELENVESHLTLYRQSYVSTESLYARSKIKKSRQIESRPVTKVDRSAAGVASNAFVSRLKDVYSREMVIREMLDLLEDGSLEVSKMPLYSNKDLVRIILSSLYGTQPKTPFTTEFSNELHENNTYRVPNNTFMKKEKP